MLFGLLFYLWSDHCGTGDQQWAYFFFFANVEEVLLLLIFGLDPCRTLVSVHHRHVQVTYYEVVLLILNKLEAVISILCGVNVVYFDLFYHLLQH
jgi:hypothetical protein